jgi:hypothetical protein
MESYSQVPASTESNLFELQLDHEGMSFLADTAKWGKFLAIVGFVFSGLMVILAFFIGNLMSNLYPLGGLNFSGFGVLGTVVYLIIAALIFFPNLFLFNFARKMQAALRNSDQSSLNASLGSLKLKYKFMGILMIIVLSFYLLLFMIGLFR